MGTVPTITTLAVGDKLTASRHAEIASAFAFLLNPPFCYLRQTSAQSIPNNTWTSVTFTTEDADTDGMHSISTNTSRVTIQTAGTYQFNGLGTFNTNASGGRAVRLAKNGTGIENSATWSGPMEDNYVGLPIAGQFLTLAVGDYVELQVIQRSGSTVNTLVSIDTGPSFSARFIGT